MQPSSHRSASPGLPSAIAGLPKPVSQDELLEQFGPFVVSDGALSRTACDLVGAAYRTTLAEMVRLTA